MASMDWLVAEVGLLHFGSAAAVYDLPTEDQVETLAIAIARSEAPEMGSGALTYIGAVQIWNAAHQKKGHDSTVSDMDSFLDGA